MRRLLAHRHGEPEQVLALADVPGDPPPPGPGEVQLAVEAAGLNFLDVMMCRGEYPQQPDPPYTPGVEAAGRVLAVGAGAEERAGAALPVGTEVLACPTLPRGALGDTVSVPAECVVPRPSDLPAVTAAALPVIYQTAWFALARAGLDADSAQGATVLVHAGAGGVGIAVTQLAHARGARVIASAGGPAKTAVCREHGAAVTVDYTREDIAAAVRDATDGHGADVVVDPVGGDVFARSLDCLAFEGRLMVVGAAGGEPPRVDPLRLAAANVSVVGLSWGSAYPWRRPAAVRRAYQELFAGCAAGTVRPPVSRVVSLADAPAALADLAARRTIGKIVVTIDGGSTEGE